jgi:hypothetical protein
MTAIQQLNNLDFERKRKEHPTFPIHCLPPSKFSDKSANDLTKAIIQFIQINGGQAERVSSMGRVINNTKTVTDCIGRKKQIGSIDYIKPTSTNGTADISAIIEGRSVKIEVKFGKDKQSEAQIKYQQKVEKAKGIYYIAKDFQSFFDWYNLNFIN